MSTPTQFKTGVQYGFFFDQTRCDGCNTCQVACKAWNNLDPGPGKMLRILQWEKGTFPNVRQRTLFAPCYHCANPVCIPPANGALIKESKYGAVLIDPAKANSTDLKAAWEACPYGAIAFTSDAPDSTAVKCTMCVDRLEQGMYPVCVMACTTRCLDFGPLDQMVSKHGSNMQLPDMPAPDSKPAIVFKPANLRKAIVPYDTAQALTLLGARPGMPPVYTDPSVVTSVAAGTTKDHPVFHAKSSEEFMVDTTDDTS